MQSGYDASSALKGFDGACRDYLYTLTSREADAHTATSWRELILALADIDLSDQEAAECGKAIVDHRDALQGALGRTVDLRLALLDYFTEVKRFLACPKIIDMERYVDTVRYGNADPLTGLSNRRHIEDQLQRELNRARRYGLVFTVLYCDLDDFKAVNDNLGHATGDAVLRAFAQHLRRHLRAEDVAARYGGEEFLVLMPRTGMDGAHCLTQRLLEDLAEQSVHPDVRISFSAGLAEFPSHGADVGQLLAHADKGLYRAKMSGKNQVIIEPPEKRRHERVPATTRVTYVDSGSTMGSGTTRDVSVSGLRISSDREPNVGQSISISVDSPKHHSHYLVGAQVVWVRRVTENRQVEFGAKYSDRTQDQARRLFSDMTADEATG